MSAVEQLYTTDMVEIVLDLPFPPSTNRLWRSARGRVFKSRDYLRWLECADMAVMAGKQFPRRKIHGPFEIDIVLATGHRGDADNRVKAILDWCQSRDIVRNDSDCHQGRWRRGAIADAPAGCRVTLRSLPQ